MQLKIELFTLGFFGLETLVMLTIVIYNFFRLLLTRSRKLYLALVGLQFIVEYLILQNFLILLRPYYVEQLGIQGFGYRPILIAIQIILTAVVLKVTAFAYRSANKYLSKASIKQALDTLPVGLLFYWSGGTVKLINSKMDEISHLLFGESIYNGNQFWDRIKDKSLELIKDTGKEDNECMIRLRNSKVYSIQKRICYFEGRKIYEITAYDVSREQLLNEELKIKRIKADEIKNRLNLLNRDIEVMTVEKEVLETKRKVHDDLGKTLIMSKRYLDTGDEKLGKEVIKQWKLNAMLLRGEEREKDSLLYTDVLRDIRKTGLEVYTEGNLPLDAKLKEVVISAIRTCANNTLRHGKGTVLYINASEVKVRTLKSFKDKDYIKIEISNNGVLPGPDFTEGGGLTNLRRAVERAGGLMNVDISVVFKVIIKLPLSES